MNDTYRKVHRLTPLLKFWSVLVALAALFFLNFNASMIASIYAIAAGDPLLVAGLTVLGFAVLCGLIWLVSGIWWRKLGFHLGQEELSLRQGVISTNLRTARYDRTQAVDVVEPFVPRLFGLAAVRVETAGGESSVIELAYLKKNEAQELRLEVLARVKGADAEELESEKDQGELLAHVPVGRAIGGVTLRLSTIWGALAVVALLFAPVPMATVVPVLIGLLPSLWRLLDTAWEFNAELETDSQTGERTLEIGYGLTNRRSQSIRLSRIHGVQIRQPLLWRIFGWYEVSVTVAGYGQSTGGASGSTRILPVGLREQAMELFELVSPLTREEIQRCAQPEGHSAPDYTSPKSARWVSPIDRKNQAVTMLKHVVVCHAGRIERRMAAIDMQHIQELTYKAGPLSQLAKVATVNFELVPGPVRMKGADLTPDDAEELLNRLRRRALPDLDGTVEA